MEKARIVKRVKFTMRLRLLVTGWSCSKLPVYKGGGGGGGGVAGIRKARPGCQ